MTPDDIAELAAGGESERLELKSTTSERREAAKTACAMLNHQGGLIIIGVAPDGRGCRPAGGRQHYRRPERRTTVD